MDKRFYVQSFSLLYHFISVLFFEKFFFFQRTPWLIEWKQKNGSNFNLTSNEIANRKKNQAKNEMYSEEFEENQPSHDFLRIKFLFFIEHLKKDVKISHLIVHIKLFILIITVKVYWNGWLFSHLETFGKAIQIFNVKVNFEFIKGFLMTKHWQCKSLKCVHL